VQLVCALDATVPYSEPMEAHLIPDAAKIVTAVQQAVGEAPVPA
jgi:pyruvate/2-oxoglutarate/acetoin dehydrogenase E1 component